MSIQDLSDDQLMAMLGQSAPQVDTRALAAAAAQRHGVPLDLVNRVMTQESGGRVDALSPKGARGPMQLMPATARDLGVDPNDPAQNIDGGVRYLKQQLNDFGGDTRLALAAYNAGPGAVRKYGGVPPYPETQDYVSRIAPETAGNSGGDVSGSPAPDLQQMSDQEFQALWKELYPQIYGDTGAGAPVDYSNGVTDKEYVDILTKAGIYTPTPDERLVKVDGRMLPIGLASRLGGYEEDGPEGKELVMTGGAPGKLDRALLQHNIDRALEQEMDWRKTLTDNAKEHYERFSPAYRTAAALTGGVADTLTLGNFDELAGALGPLVSDLDRADSTAVMRQFVGMDRADHPVASISGQLAGGALLPGAKFLGGARSLPGAMLRGSALGAGYGAAYGAGSAEGGLDERAQGALAGGAIGAGLGAGFPLAARGVTNATRPAVQSLASMSDRMGLPLPASIPRRMVSEDQRVAEVLSRNIGRDGATVDTLAMAGGPLLPFERAGENLVGLAEIAAQAPGKARSLAVERLSGRTAAAGDRTQEAIGNALGGKGDYLASLDAKMAARKAEADQGIAAIGEHLVKLDENSIIALRSELASDAVEQAAKNALASPEPEIRNAGAALRGLKEKLLDNPNGTTIRVRDAQDISRALNEAASSAYSGGDGGRGDALKTLAKAIRQNARDPERGGFADYDAWLTKYGDDTDNIKALEAGRDVFSPRLERSAEALRRDFAGLSDVGKDNFRKGVGEALIAQVRSRKGGVGAMRDLLRSTEFADRVRIAFPDKESFDGFMGFAKREVDMQARANQVTANSATARRQLAAQDVEQPLSGADFIIDNMTTDVGALAGKGLKAALKNVPRKDRGVLTNPKMNAQLGEALFGEGDTLERLLRDLEQQRALRTALQRQGQIVGGKGARGGTAVATDRTSPAR